MPQNITKQQSNGVEAAPLKQNRKQQSKIKNNNNINFRFIFSKKCPKTNVTVLLTIDMKIKHNVMVSGLAPKASLMGMR